MRTGNMLRAAAQLAVESRAAARMRAWRVHTYGGLSELRLEDARVPPLRAPDDVLVRVNAASINPIDVNMIGGYGARVMNTLRAFEGESDVEFPLVPGRDFVGTVERAGPASRLRPGQRVWGVVPPYRQGSHAQYVVVKDQWTGPAPKRLQDVEAGGALYAALTATAALRAAGLGSRSRVLLLGLGGVGQAALQLLVQRHAEVTVGCSGELTDVAMKLGAAYVFDRHQEDYYKKLEQGGPYDAIFDCAGLGGDEASAHGWRFSRYVTLTTPLLRDTDTRGLGAGALSAAAALLLHSARVASRALRSADSPPNTILPPHVRWAFFAANADDIELLRRLAEKGEFTVIVEQVYGWKRGAEAFERASKGSARGKLVLDFTSQDTGTEPITTRDT